MKICMCAGTQGRQDGIADYAAHLSVGLRSLGAEVDHVRLGYYEPARAFYDNAAAAASSGDVCHVQFNYVYFNGELPYRNSFVYFAKRVSKPMVMTAHEVRLRLEPSPRRGLKGLIYNCALPVINGWSLEYHREMYASASAVITHTKGHLAAVRSMMKAPERASIIPHGVPAVPEADSRYPRDEAKRALGLAGKTVLSIFGFINPRKGYSQALDALRRAGENTVLLIAGGSMTENMADKEFYRKLTAEIKARSPAGRAVITGYLDHERIKVAMAATDIVLAPYDSSAASGALALAIGYGKAIVASDIPVHEEICERVPCLKLFRSGDAGDLAEKIKTLSEGAGERQRLSEAALRYAAEYSYAKVASKTMEVYKSVVRR